MNSRVGSVVDNGVAAVVGLGAVCSVENDGAAGIGVVGCFAFISFSTGLGTCDRKVFYLQPAHCKGQSVPQLLSV